MTETWRNLGYFGCFSLSLMICQYHPWHTCQFSCIRHQSPALPYGTQNLQDKIEYWAFLSFNLQLIPSPPKIWIFFDSQFGFWGIFAHISSLTKIISKLQSKGKLWWSVPHVRLHIQGFHSGPGTGKIDQLWMWLSLAA